MVTTAIATAIVVKTGAGETGTTGDTTAKNGNGGNTSGVSMSVASMSGANTGAGRGSMSEDILLAVTFIFSTDVRNVS
jgi:hypothetical protein